MSMRVYEGWGKGARVYVLFRDHIRTTYNEA